MPKVRILLLSWERPLFLTKKSALLTGGAIIKTVAQSVLPVVRHLFLFYFLLIQKENGNRTTASFNGVPLALSAQFFFLHNRAIGAARQPPRAWQHHVMMINSDHCLWLLGTTCVCCVTVLRHNFHSQCLQSMQEEGTQEL